MGVFSRFFALLLPMSHALSTHVVALRRQIRRLQRVVASGTLATLGASAALLTTPRAGWMSFVLLLALAGYLQRKVRQVIRAHRAVKQLRLEEQFVRHGPAPAEVLTCVRRRNHLWTQSLTLKALKELLSPSPRVLNGDTRRQVRRQYRRSFGALRPARVPVDLLWFCGLLGGWFVAVPEALFQQPPPALLLGAALLLPVLLAEVLQAVLQADLRDGFDDFTALLSDWTMAREFEATLQAARRKHYRHTPLYRVVAPALGPPPAQHLHEIA